MVGQLALQVKRTLHSSESPLTSLGLWTWNLCINSGILFDTAKLQGETRWIWICDKPEKFVLTCLLKYLILICTQHRISQGFFFSWRVWVSPMWQKCCPSPNLPLSQLFDQSLFSLSFVPENFKNFISFFSQFWLLFSSKLHQKALFCLKHQNLLWGAFLASADNFSKSPLIWLTVADGDWKSSPKASPPTKNFVKKTCLYINVQCRHTWSYTVKTPVLKLTPDGVNTGPISDGVNLTPFWCYFNTFLCFSSPVGMVLFQHRKVLK